MNRNVHSIWPPMRYDFNRVVSGRYGARQEPAYELYFRDAAPDHDAKMGFFDKAIERN